MATISEALAIAVQHHQTGQLQAAEQIYRHILAVDPDQTDALHLLGVIASQNGKQDFAIEFIRRAIALNPRNCAFHGSLGNVFKGQGKLDDAVASYCRALELNPDYAVAHFNLGDALKAQGKLNDAVASYRRALELNSEDAGAHYNLGTALQAQGKLDQAVGCFRQALEQRPNYAEAYSSLGHALNDQGKATEAVACCHRALELNPDDAEAHYNLGVAFKAQGKLEEAVARFGRALELKPDFAPAHNNLGAVLQAQGRLDDAAVSYRRALELNPEYALAHNNQSMLRLLQGDLRRGWSEYEWRWKMDPPGASQLAVPRWDGRSLDERSILLHAEQGLGDTLQFVRYALLVKKRFPAATVVLACQRPLKKLLATCPGIDRLIAEGDDLPPLDFHAPLLTLPGIFDTTLETIPTEVPYLFAEAVMVARWRERLSNVGGLRIGINWQGRPGQGDFQKRNIPLEFFAALGQLPGVSLVSLQKGEGRNELINRGANLPILDLGDDVDAAQGAFIDTAAIMMNLDLLITSDTSVPHLAGALGVPVWLALPFVPDWRWLLSRTDSPWYPTMRLFRQNRPGDWAGVFKEIETALCHEITTLRAP